METTKTRIELEGEFTAAELDEILRDLAKARAGLSPPVPDQPPTVLAADEDVLVQEEARFAIRTLANGGLRIWLRNEGLGWLAFTITPAQTLSLRQFLGQKVAHSHTSH